MKPPEEQRPACTRPSKVKTLSAPGFCCGHMGGDSGGGGVGYDVTLRPSHSSSCDPLQPLDYAGYQFTLEHLALRPSSLSVENKTLARLLKPDVSICGSMPKITGQLFSNLF